MKNLWNREDAGKLGEDPLGMRVYSSRLIGQEEDLVLHGGGNTSVKTKEANLFDEREDILHVKGSGWDLATIEKEGFSPVRLSVLKRMVELEQLSDVDMVRHQRSAMTDPTAPNPSVEAILHAIIPFTFVDHTHADAVVTISNTRNGEDRIKEIYGNRVLIVPYVMPGFVLAREVYKLTRQLDWNSIEAIILLNHGVFTFADEARSSYNSMIAIVSEAEEYLSRCESRDPDRGPEGEIDTLGVAKFRHDVSDLTGRPILAQSDNSSLSLSFSEQPELQSIADRGPLTPDHIIRTKRAPIVLTENLTEDLQDYSDAYRAYFGSFTDGTQTMLDPAPRWAVWPGRGTLCLGSSIKDVGMVRDIAQHTMKAIFRAEQLGGWHTLGKRDLFEMEYWTLEQEKLKKPGTPNPMLGRIALVTGAVSGIGKACVERLVDEGAVVAALDLDPEITTCYDRPEILNLECDVTDSGQLRSSVERTVAHFGGIDMLVSNAGIFPQSFSITGMDDGTWRKSMDINLDAHRQLLKLCVPYLEVGIDAAVVMMGSKNVAAPGPGASAYSVAKAGLSQLSRIAALELGEKGIRVNVLHPNAVYDTAIWTADILKERAENYGLTVTEYKENNVLRTEVTSKDVAELAVLMLGPGFSKTTGAQIPIDGGNERVI